MKSSFRDNLDVLKPQASLVRAEARNEVKKLSRCFQVNCATAKSDKNENRKVNFAFANFLVNFSRSKSSNWSKTMNSDLDQREKITFSLLEVFYTISSKKSIVS